MKSFLFFSLINKPLDAKRKMEKLEEIYVANFTFREISPERQTFISLSNNLIMCFVSGVM